MGDVRQDIEDALAAVISDSLEPEWTPYSCAHHIMSQLDVVGLRIDIWEGSAEPDAPGSFQGDLWYGDPTQRALPTHQWDGECWRRLPELLRGRAVAV